MKKRGLKVYFIHSGKIDYNKMIYMPVLKSNLLSHHTLIFPTSEENKNKYYKDLMGSADLYIVELTDPDIGFEMEVKEAVISKKPILALAQKNLGYNAKFQKYFSEVIGYSTEDELRYFIETFVNKYDGKIYNGKTDKTVVLGLLN